MILEMEIHSDLLESKSWKFELLGVSCVTVKFKFY